MVKKIVKYIISAMLFIFYTLLSVICLLGIDVFAAEHIAGIDTSYIQHLPAEEPEQESEWIYLGKFEITFYCDCTICTGAGTGITSTGQPVEAHRTIAVDPNVIPYFTEVRINGLDYTYQATDCGGAIKGNRIDVYVADHDYALQLGRWKQIDVWILKGE